MHARGPFQKVSKLLQTPGTEPTPCGSDSHLSGLMKTVRGDRVDSQKQNSPKLISVFAPYRLVPVYGSNGNHYHLALFDPITRTIHGESQSE